MRMNGTMTYENMWDNITLNPAMDASWNVSGNTSFKTFQRFTDHEGKLSWGVLALSLLIVAAALGNVLVCLAVCWEKRLQNMTNYFLMSLAMADLLVSVLVMPLGMVVELFGYFPLNANLCVVWAAMDVLMCTASIWHMCTMSMDRYFTLKYPMKYGRNKTKTMVVMKITFVWIISIALCSPICIMGFLDHTHVYNDGHCIPTIREFIIYGSIFAFYVPLFIMVVTYVLTIQILCNNQKLMNQIAKEHKIGVSQPKEQHHGSGGQYYSKSYLSTEGGAQLVDAHSLETSFSYNNTSINDSATLRNPGSESPKGGLVEDPCTTEDCITPDSPKEAALINNLSSHPRLRIDRASLSISQPHLPSFVENPLQGNQLSATLKLPRASSHSTINYPSPTRNYYQGYMCIAINTADSPGYFKTKFPDSFMSATSLNSMLSKTCGGSAIFSELDDPEMLEKLSQIEQEMDECLQDIEAKEQPVSEGPATMEVQSDGEQKDTPMNTCQCDSGASMDCSVSEVLLGDCLVGRRSSQSRAGNDTREMITENCHGDSHTTYISPAHRHNDEDQPAHCDCEPGDSNLSSPSEETTSMLPPPIIQIPEDSPSKEEAFTPDSEIMTITLQTNGCYMYKLNQEISRDCLSPRPDTPRRRVSFPHEESLASSSSGSDSEDHVTLGSSTITGKSQLCIQEATKSSAQVTPLMHRCSKGWKAFLHPNRNVDKKDIKVLAANQNGVNKRHSVASIILRTHHKNYISRRTASNEKKASKVLGIIFAVFVVLWTPFFIVNIVTVVCAPCLAALTPPMMASIVWLGYLSSLANPIIYTMFNTAFRKAFYKILMCKYPHQLHSKSDTYHLTNQANWQSERRPTVQLKQKTLATSRC